MGTGATEAFVDGICVAPRTVMSEESRVDLLFRPAAGVNAVVGVLSILTRAHA